MPEIMVCEKLRSYEKGTTFLSIAEDYQSEFDSKITQVYFNGKMTELMKKVEKDGVLNFITMSDSAGHKTYIRTAEMMLIKAVRNLAGEKAGEARVHIEFALHNSVYCLVSGVGREIDEAYAKALQEEMEKMQEANIPIIKKSYPVDAALELFKKQNMTDKIKMFRYRRSSSINVYNLDGFYDYFYGHMLPNTGMVDLFKVSAYRGGILLTFPTRENPNELEYPCLNS